MALNKIYTDNTVVMKRNGGTLAWVATKPYNELFGENEFDLSILLNNSSTSKMLNNGAYGKNPTKYLDLKTIASGEPTVPIQFLGCFLSTTDSISYGFNITKKTPFINENLGGDSWQQFINNFRFIIDFIPATNNISYETYQDFDYNNTTAVKYGFGTTYIEFNAEYNKSNISNSSNVTKNPELISGDDAKRFLFSNISVTTTNYNKYLDDTTQLTKEWLCILWYAFRVNGDLIIIRYPEYMPTSGEYKTRVELPDGTYEFLTIGGFSDTVIDGTTGGLPENDDTKGLFVSYMGRGSNYYYSTNNAIMHNTNSSGIRWTVNEITTAKNFRDYVRLGVMDTNGLITHNEWLQGETGIANSDNPNKNGNYSDLPEWKPSGGDDKDDDSDDINFGYMFSGAGAFTNLWYCTQKDLADLRQWFLGADAQHPIPEGFDPMPSIIGLFQYPISLGGDVLEEIKFRTSSGLIVSTGVQAARGLSTNLKFDLGSINIPARMRERGVPFLDYESTVECYVPFCGVFQLDTQTVIGKTLSCTLWMSPATGECNCIVYTISNGIKAPVAYGSGNMSSQIPISSNGWGSYAAALKNATIQKNQIISGAAAGGVSSLLSGAGNLSSTLELGEQLAGISMGKKFGSVGMVLGGAGTALGIISTGIKAYQDINAANVGIRHLKASNGTSINGAFSGQSAWNYPMTPYVKISRPHYKKPNNYAHTQGIPLVEAKKLSECSGFTMCVGADLTGITATQTERDIISAYLTNGIIV